MKEEEIVRPEKANIDREKIKSSEKKGEYEGNGRRNLIEGKEERENVLSRRGVYLSALLILRPSAPLHQGLCID